MATILRGKLAAARVRDFSGYALSAGFEERARLGDGAGVFVAGRRDTPADGTGAFTFELPDPADRRGPVTLTAFAPDGLPAGGLVIPGDLPADPVEVAVSPRPATQVPPSGDITLGQQLKYTGLAIDPHGRGVASDLLLVIWGRAAGAEQTTPVSVTRTAAGGYFSGPWPGTTFAEAYAVLAGSAPIPIGLEAGLLPRRIVLQTPALPPPPPKDDDCHCPDSPPRAPDQVDLTGNAQAYASDAARCVDFTLPNRALDEVTYQAVVRTTQPQIKGTTPTTPPVIPGVLVDRLVELARVRPVVVNPVAELPPAGQSPAAGLPQTGPFTLGATATSSTAGHLASIPGTSGRDAGSAPVAASGQGRQVDVVPGALAAARAFVPGIDLDGRWASVNADLLAARVLEQRALAGEPLRLETSVLADLAREQQDITPLRLVMAEQTSVVRRFRAAVGLLASPEPARFTLDADRQVDWDGLPYAYQATTVAHGHLLTIKQVWRADGYSLGDLLYSLPLAPGQQKLVSVLDWNRSEVASRRAERTEAEDLVADLSHDRDISDVIRSTLTESMRGHSKADVEAVGAGIAGFIGPLVFGAAGGVSSAGSTANQTSARAVTGTALNQVRDRTLQSASAVRSQRSTVVQTARQGESVRAQTEVVANYNHCHALTVEYFEVLRHLQVSQELAAVQECLFIPFAVTPFTAEKALRWREPLERGLRRRSLHSAFDSLERVRANWVGSDLPVGRYADEALVDLDGELAVRVTLPRPADGESDEFVSTNWDGYAALLWDGPASIWERYLGVALPAERDAIWDSRIAPGVAQRLLETMQMSLIEDGVATRPVSVDPAMVGLFGQDRPLLVGLQAGIPLPTVLRSQIDRVRLSLAVSVLPPGARIVVDSGSLRYRTAHLSHQLFLNRRILNDLSLGDDVEIAVPLDATEKRNPRDRDRRHAERLLDHLDEHVEHYHRAIWLTMDPNRRYLLLDGFVAPDAGGRSVASVVENRVVGVVGNSLVMPVAPGLKLDATYEFARATPADLRHLYAADPAPPMRISMPTSGVFAEAVLGKCNSCEVIDDTKFWRWEEAPIPDQPPSIDPLSTGSRRTAPPNLAPDQFPTPVVGYQQVPTAPDPTGLAAAMAALGTPNIFKDLTGLALNQQNAAEALKTSITAAQGFASKAGALAQQRFLNQELDRSLGHIKEARDKGLVSADDARALTESVLRGAIGEVRPATPSATRTPSVQRAIDRLATSGSGSLRVTRPEGTVSVKTGTAAGRPALDVAISPAVVPVKQNSSLVCWAAGGTIMSNWKTGQAATVEQMLDGLGGVWRSRYDLNQPLSVVELRAFLAAVGLTEDEPTSYTPEGLARLVENVGPLLDVGDDGIENNQVLHIRILTGVKGDGTPDGTTTSLADPATGTVVTETFHVFDQLHGGADPVASMVGVFHF
ncbi:papain-like cysteine protease family protein [Micromonospora soli]|uniref:papain-like cysteine protease family protein n=1 Tax=Micromonospora sp. NBRC 110009 TaxID=3061627 RepID=UPI0026735D85|nr:papain-like cysteine protease family protein [Micromonospora sp. NBRC 110009]WKT99266.1 papain-like cysteine protease family protein [Micromonospora sp. NBRC 110009]